MKRSYRVWWFLALLLVSGYVILESENANAAAPRITIKVAQCCPPDQAYGVYAHGLADSIQKLSNNEMKVDCLDGGVLGGEQDMAQAVQIGTIQMAAVTGNNVAQLAPSMNILVLPYINSTMDDVIGPKGLLSPGPYFEELKKRVLKESGSLLLMGGFTNGFRLFFTKNKCVQTMADLKGLKIRIPKNPVMEAMWNALGVSPYPIDWSETFTAIQQGVADAFDSPLDTILRMGFYQDIKYVIDVHYSPQAAVLIVNNNWFQGLSKADQEIVSKAVRENDINHYNFVKQDQITLKETLEKKHGTKFCELKDEDVWKEKCIAIWPKLYRYIGGGKDWVDLTMEYKKTGVLKQP
jgi:TRAP-type transport system periplasmic protein